jgi:hypothetical protein
MMIPPDIHARAVPAGKLTLARSALKGTQVNLAIDSKLRGYDVLSLKGDASGVVGIWDLPT